MSVTGVNGTTISMPLGRVAGPGAGDAEQLALAERHADADHLAEPSQAPVRRRHRLAEADSR